MVKRTPIHGPEYRGPKRHVKLMSDRRSMWFQEGKDDEWFTGMTPYPISFNGDGKPVQDYAHDSEMLHYIFQLQELRGPIVLSHCWSIYNWTPERSADHGYVKPTSKTWNAVKDLAAECSRGLDDMKVDVFSLDAKKVTGNALVSASRWVEQLYCYIYYVMIAEENHPKTKLGKRIKMLGLIQTLSGESTSEEAACCSCGMDWRDIDEMCKKRGII